MTSNPENLIVDESQVQEATNTPQDEVEPEAKDKVPSSNGMRVPLDYEGAP